MKEEAASGFDCYDGSRERETDGNEKVGSANNNYSDASNNGDDDGYSGIADSNYDTIDNDGESDDNETLTMRTVAVAMTIIKDDNAGNSI
ncbi:unnamed protein product [Gongylonema pulchrum]|uniref:Dentin sialophosphoprotein-like n=1 Tax=Gongylonema pulchrum TaxID=637853 RepID=A0A183CX63_9BILA|nr:unnamed protein product [Gongylonema pulchrum]